MQIGESPSSKGLLKIMKSKSIWMKLTNEGKMEFQKIVKILNKYYALIGKENEFRKSVLEANQDNLTVYLKKFATTEYLVAVEVLPDTTKESERFLLPKKDSWIHIDGVEQERQLLTRKGITKHPVFTIMSLGDLYDSHSTKVTKNETKELVNAS